MKVREVMHSGVEWVEPDTGIGEIAEIMRDEDIGAVPVGEGDRLIGMVTDRDIVCKGLTAGNDWQGLTARDVMSKPILYCRADEDVEDAIRIMEKNRIRRLPVIDEDKRMVGMLALGDICAKAGRILQAK